MHCLYPHPQSNVVQINAPEYNSDIDGQTDQLPDIQPSTASNTTCAEEASADAENIQEDTAPITANSGEHPATSQDSDRPECQSQPVLDTTGHSVYQDIKQPREEYPNTCRPQLEDIPDLIDNEENWEGGQFADADIIDHHNTTEESATSTLHILRRLQTRDTAPRIIACKDWNLSLNQNITIWTPDQTKVPKSQCIPPSLTIHRRFTDMAWMRPW